MAIHLEVRKIYPLLIALCFNISCKPINSQNEAQDTTEIETNNTDKSSILTTFPKAQYLEDLNQLLVHLNNHPQLHEYISEESLKNLIEEKKALITDDFKIGEFTWLCRSIISEIGCGHTVVPTLGLNYFLPDSFLFPLKVAYLKNKLYVIDPLINKEQVSKGDEILAINGISINELIKELANHVSADAGNMSSKLAMINNGFMEYAAFEFKFTDKYVIDITQGEEIKTVTLNQLSTYTEEPHHDSCESLCFEVDEENDLAIMTIRSFYYYRDNFTIFETFIDSCFGEIKSNQIQNLIIDLRDNGGGDPYCGSYLLQHIANKPYQYYKTGTYAYADLQNLISPHKNRFTGKPHIFINGRCFSTTGQLCALIKENDFGIFIGKETGATYRCNATVKPFELTNTGITPFIATRTFEAHVTTLPKDKGIMPDYEPEREITDLLQNKDVDLEFYINLRRHK